MLHFRHLILPPGQREGVQPIGVARCASTGRGSSPATPAPFGMLTPPEFGHSLGAQEVSYGLFSPASTTAV